jgi:hypothetical protein
MRVSPALADRDGITEALDDIVSGRGLASSWLGSTA